MINKSKSYKTAIVGDARRMYIEIIADLIDPNIVYGAVESQSASAYSKSTEIYDKNFTTGPKFATLEDDRWALDGTFHIYPDDPNDITTKMGYQSEALSGSDGMFETAQYVELRLSGVSILQSLSVYFPDNDYDGVPENYTIEVYQGGTVYAQETITGNTNASYSYEGFTVYSPDAIRITVTKMSKPYRRLRVTEIVPGVYERWSDDVVTALSIKHQIDVTCMSLPYGSCTFTLDNQNKRFDPRNKDGVFETLSERKAIPVRLGTLLPNGTIDYTNVGTFFQRSTGWKLADSGLTIQWDMVDIVGLLADRAYTVPSTLPTTLEGWISDLMAQLGKDFEYWYTIDSDYSSKEITALSASALEGIKCGDLLRYVCMSAGCFPRADNETGYLAIEPVWNAGNSITLDNLNDYPEISANADLALIEFTLSDGTVYTVNGNDTSSNETVSIKNPFIHTTTEALDIANNLLTFYGGNSITITGRGDMSSECGDVDRIQVDDSVAVSARRSSQVLAFSGGVMRGCTSTLIQPSGAYLANTREVITSSGTWTAPGGVTSLSIIVVGPGESGGDGTDGGMFTDGVDGADGLGGYVYADTININEGQTFEVTIDSTQTLFGIYSAANGQRYNGYTDIRSGNVYARDAIASPVMGSGDGGVGGKGGKKSYTAIARYYYDDNGNKVYYDGIVVYVDDVQTYPPQQIYYEMQQATPAPTKGTAGVPGATGSVIIWYATPKEG